MKYCIIVPDGSADTVRPSALELANIENINNLANNGIVGFVKTIPDGLTPGSDCGNLSLMGYDPTKYLTGRSALEVAGADLPMMDNEYSYRVNFVKFSNEDKLEDCRIISSSADNISNEVAREVFDIIENEFNNIGKLYRSVGYRNLLISNYNSTDDNIVPPHDIVNQKLDNYLPKDKILLDIINKCRNILRDEGYQSNGVWIWGKATKPNLNRLTDKYGITGSVISAVDLVLGIGKLAGLNTVQVPCITGDLNTNYYGKGIAAVKELIYNNKDFVYVHVEAPDECSHNGDLSGKIYSLECIDKLIVKTIIDGLSLFDEDYRIIISPDHITSVESRIHRSEPVPFVYYDSTEHKYSGNVFNESQVSDLYLYNGYDIVELLMKGDTTKWIVK